MSHRLKQVLKEVDDLEEEELENTQTHFSPVGTSRQFLQEPIPTTLQEPIPPTLQERILPSLGIKRIAEPPNDVLKKKSNLNSTIVLPKLDESSLFSKGPQKTQDEHMRYAKLMARQNKYMRENPMDVQSLDTDRSSYIHPRDAIAPQSKYKTIVQHDHEDPKGSIANLLQQARQETLGTRKRGGKRKTKKSKKGGRKTRKNSRQHRRSSKK